jgi:hypothetical protein
MDIREEGTAVRTVIGPRDAVRSYRALPMSLLYVRGAVEPGDGESLGLL